MAESGFLTLSVRDYDNEIGRTRVRVPIITLANFAAQEVLRNAFIAAYGDMIWGVLANTQFGNANLISSALPVNNAADREDKWMVQFHDATTMRKFKIEIPAPDESLKDPNDHKHAQIGDAGVVDAFVDAFEGYARTVDGNLPVVDEITHVGRNL